MIFGFRINDIPFEIEWLICQNLKKYRKGAYIEK